MPDGVVYIAAVRFEELLEYDARMFPVPRPQFLSYWIDQPDGAALAVVEDGNRAGYGVIRKCRIGYQIGPLFANNTQIAETLFAALRSTVPGEPIFLDTPEVNPAAIDLAERHHLNVMFETVRMYSNGEPALPLNCVFGVTSFELG
jgi:hypothetical protein